MGYIISKNFLLNKDIKQKKCIICGTFFPIRKGNIKTCENIQCRKKLREDTLNKYRILSKKDKIKKKIKRRIYQEKECTRCNKKFIPKSGNQKTCNLLSCINKK